MMAEHDTIAAPKPFAHEIAAYTDEQLDRYLELNGRVVRVQDPENVSLDFIQRLRDIVQRPCAAAQSSVVDLDQVAARLQTVPSDPEPFNRSPSPSTTASPDPEGEYLEDLRQETEAYPALIRAGGRPPYPLPLLEEFLNNPEQYLEHDQYRDIVGFWRQRVSNKDERTLFCRGHLSRWGDFRRLQHIIRKHSVKNETELVNAAYWKDWEAFLDHPASKDWTGQWGFQEYAEKMKARLTKYGFTRPFQLERDLGRQNKLTTWIEYLGYEYWFYDWPATVVQRFQRRHDNAWERLVESNTLRPGETYDVICDVDTVFQMHGEEESAKKAVQSATAAVSSTERAMAKSHSSAETLRKRLLADQSTLSAAKARHDSLCVRIDAITAFKKTTMRYRRQKDEAEHYKLLLRWIVQQIPSIELELNSLESEQDDRACEDSSRSLECARPTDFDEGQASVRGTPPGSPSLGCETHKRSRCVSIDDERPLKRLKSSSREGLADLLATGASAPATSKPTTDTTTTQKIGSSNVSTVEPLRLRRSARIAERTKKSAISAKRQTPPLSIVPGPSERNMVSGKCAKRRRVRRRMVV